MNAINKKNIAVLFGGNSPEYEISLSSAYSVIKNIDDEKYNKVLIGITREGSWYHYQGSLDKIKNNTWFYDESCNPTMVFPHTNVNGLMVFQKDKTDVIKLDGALPILHGKNGEDGTVQGIFALADIPIIGCDTLSSALCMHKDKAHKIVEAAGVKSPKSLNIVKEEIDELGDLELKGFSFPLFIKPSKAGSSYGISKVSKKEQLKEALSKAFEFDDEAVIEETIDGFEVGCSVLGKRDLVIGVVDEIELHTDFFDFEEKYHRNTATIHMPARISNENSNAIKKAAEVIYKSLGCSGFARVDMFLTSKGDIYFNEVNTIPGFTDCSRFPNMLKGAGFSFPQILDYIIDSSINLN